MVANNGFFVLLQIIQYASQIDVCFRCVFLDIQGVPEAFFCRFKLSPGFLRQAENVVQEECVWMLLEECLKPGFKI